MKTSLKLLIATISLEFILSLVAIIVVSNELKSNLVLASGKMLKIKQSITSFDSLDIKGNITVHWIKSDSSFVDMQIDSVFKKDIVVFVEKGVLKIIAPKVFRKKSMVFVIYSPTVSQIQLDNGSLFLTDDTLKTSLLKLSLNDGSESKIKFKGQQVDVFAQNGSFISMVGNALKTSVQSLNGSSIKMDHFDVSNGNFTAQSGSSIDLTVKDTLIASSLSGSNINIYGNPKVKQIKADISSSVE